MDGLDKTNIEKLLSDPSECGYRVMLREFFEYQISLKCPFKEMLDFFYKRLQESQNNRESGL